MQNETTPKTLEERVLLLETKIKRYERIIFWFVVINVALVVLPAIGLMLVVPEFLSTYTDMGSQLGV